MTGHKESSDSTFETPRAENYECARLFELATPDIYRQNSFRVMGLPVWANPRDVQRQRTTLKIAAKFGVNSGSYNGGCLPLSPAPGEDDISKAVQRLLDPESLFIDELFWFWPQNFEEHNDASLELLSAGRVKEAAALWQQEEKGHQKREVAAHNMAVLYHAWALDFEHRMGTRALPEKERDTRRICWENAYNRWVKLMDNDIFWSRVRARVRAHDDPRLTTGMARRIHECLPKALLLINARLAARAASSNDSLGAKFHVELMRRSGFGDSQVDEALRESLATVRERIAFLCKPAESAANSNPRGAANIARRLLQDVEPLLTTINFLLPKGSPIRDAAYDQVVDAALTCNVAFGNATENWRECDQFLERVQPLACGYSLRKRIEDGLAAVKNYMVYNYCFFCQKERAVDGAELSYPMHGNVQRHPTLFSGTQVTWQHITGKVPRCAVCKTCHERAARSVGGIIGAIGAALFGGQNQAGRTPDDVRPVGHARTFPPIAELLSQGWEYGEKPTGV